MTEKWVGVFVYRAWYYFRTGYSTYLTFILGYASTLVTVYYLAIKNAPELLSIFPKFWPFAILSTITGVPLAVVVGWVHMKRSNLYSAEADIGVESSPYSYKLPPGYWKEALVPTIMAELRMLRRLSEANGLLTESDKSEVEELNRKMDLLVKGGYLGVPRRTTGALD